MVFVVVCTNPFINTKTSRLVNRLVDARLIGLCLHSFKGSIYVHVNDSPPPFNPKTSKHTSPASG